MKHESYWSRLTAGRPNRHQILAGTAVTSGALALSIACGGGSAKSTKSDNQPTSLPVPVDTSAQAVAGGSMLASYTNEVNNWDPHIAGTWWGNFGGPVLCRLFRVEPGHLQDSDGSISGEFVQSWEFSPDRLTMTAKLRPKMPWHPIAPVNGRNADSSDVAFSWTRFLSLGANRASFANSINPGAPIVSVTTPDSATVVMKLAYPMVTLPAQLASVAGGSFQIVPKETDGGYDIRRQVIGTGPFYVAEHVPSVRITLKRNPNYYVPNHPFVDSVEYPIVPEYATGLSQFKSGGIYAYSVRQEDILALKSEVPALTMMQSELSANDLNSYFGYRPTSKSVMRDERVRQAYSMSWDRDLFIDVAANVSQFKKDGIPVRTAWNSSIPSNLYTGWWLDPKSKDFGPNGQYFQHNVAEAKKLLAAAGYPNGVEVTSNHITTSEYGTDYLRSIEVLEGMNVEAGFRFPPNIVSYQTEFVPQFRDSSGNFEGVAYRRLTPSQNDAVELLVTLFSKASGVSFVGLDQDGKGDFSGDAYLEDQLLKARSEPDTARRQALVQDVQRYLGKRLYYMKWPGAASGLDIVWPAVKNYRVFQRESRGYLNEWLDKKAGPFNR